MTPMLFLGYAEPVHTFCWYNGKVTEAKKSGVPLNDVGILRGYGVFDYLRTYGTAPFLYREHYLRFVHSAQTLGLKVPLSEQEMRKAIETLVRKNKAHDCAVRMVLTGGVSPNGTDYEDPNCYILTEDLKTIPAALYEKGARLITYEHDRQFREAKTTNYLTYLMLQKKVTQAGAVEVLYCFDGAVRECATSNFFIFRGNTLVTPRRDVLIGITRNCVIALAKNDHKVLEREITVQELRLADEAFITATNKEIIPIVRIDGRKVGTGKVGERTRALMDSFREATLSR